MINHLISDTNVAFSDYFIFSLEFPVVKKYFAAWLDCSQEFFLTAAIFRYRVVTNAVMYVHAYVLLYYAWLRSHMFLRYSKSINSLPWSQVSNKLNN